MLTVNSLVSESATLHFKVKSCFRGNNYQNHIIMVQISPSLSTLLRPWIRCFKMIMFLNKQQINWEKAKESIKKLGNGQLLTSEDLSRI